MFWLSQPLQSPGALFEIKKEALSNEATFCDKVHALLASKLLILHVLHIKQISNHV